MIKQIVDVYGEKAQLDITIEECAELIHAASKYKRVRYGGYRTGVGKEYARDKLVESIAQAVNAINSLVYIAGISEEKIKSEIELSDKETYYMTFGRFSDDDSRTEKENVEKHEGTCC